ncbi:unnamed protein product [Choristocarpus tenellus]
MAREVQYQVVLSSGLVVMLSVLVTFGLIKWRRKRREVQTITLQYHLTRKQLEAPATSNSTMDNAMMKVDDFRFRRRSAFFKRIFPRKLHNVDYYHIAGTNGKGSVCELLRCCLVANGHLVGTFTSPHIHTIRERIRIGGDIISMDDFVRHAATLQCDFQNNLWLLPFDKLLAIALLHFAEAGADTIILEVGIGGKYDSTNFIERPPTASIITSISYDHQSLLGNSLEEIAEQKAGIIKPSSVVFTCTSQTDTSMQVLKEVADRNNSDLVLVRAEDKHPYLNITAGNRPSWVLADNIRLVEAVAAHLGLDMKGLQQASWPCRFEVFEVGLQRTPLVIDGAHNEGSMSKLMEQLNERFPHRGVHIVFGAAADKNVEAMLKIAHVASVSLFLVCAPHPRAMYTHELHKILEPEGIKHTHTTKLDNLPVERGLELALQTCAKGDIVLVCGSFLVASRARQWLANEQPSLFSRNDWVHESDVPFT